MSEQPQPTFLELASDAMDAQVLAILTSDDATAAQLQQARQWIKQRQSEVRDPDDPMAAAIRAAHESRATGGQMPALDLDGDDEAMEQA